MPNMDYCKFENTYNDLLDCYNAMQSRQKLSSSEKAYKEDLIKLCITISLEFGDQV